MIYQLLVLYILTVAFFYKIIKETQVDSWNGRKYFLIPVFTVLFLIMGCRSISVGVDTSNYSYIYREIVAIPFVDLLDSFYVGSIEIGFALFAKISSLLLDDYYFFQLLNSFLFCFLMGKFIKDNSTNFITATILFVSLGIYLLAFNITRQMLAVAMVANSYTYFSIRKYRIAISLFLLSISFHVSAIVSTLIYLLYCLRGKKKIFSLIPVVLIVFVFAFEIVMSIIGDVFVRYANYYANNREIQEANMVKIIWCLEFLFSLYILYAKNKFNSKNKFVAVMCMIYVVSNYIGLSFNYFERVGLYFSPFLILLFEIYGNSLSNKIVRYGYYTVLNVCFLMFFLRASSSGQYLYTLFF